MRKMILSAEMNLRGSLFRTESRRSHNRLDYLKTDEVNWQAGINLYQNPDQEMLLETQPFGTSPELG